MIGFKRVSCWIFFPSIFFLLLLTGGCENNKKAQDVINLGFIGPLTGPAGAYGDAQMKGIKLAVEQINTSGGINGKSVNVIFEDSQLDPNKSLSAIKKLIDIDKVVAVIGETSTAGTLAIADTANKNKTVLLSPSASGEKITDAGDYVFRASPSDSFQAIIIAKFAYSKGFRKGAVVYTNDDWGSGLKKAFDKSFTSLGGEIVLAEGCTPKTQDFRTQLVKIKELHPDFIYIPLYPEESPTFLRQIKELEVAVQIIGADSFSEKAILNTTGTTANGVIFAMPAESRSEEYTAYLAKYKSKFNADGNYSSAAAYDCVYLLADAIKKSGLEGEQIKNALYAIKNYKGASGLIGFDNNGDVTTKEFSIIKIENGDYTTIKN